MPGGFIEREGRYSWAYLLRRPNFDDANVVTVSVVVYSGRSQAVLGETTYYVDWVAGTNSVKVYWQPNNTPPVDKPAVKPGNWVLDATVLTKPTNNPYAPDPHGFFYRVVGVTESYDPGVNQPFLLLELQTPIKRGNPVAGQGILVVMDNVAEVFEKGAGWAP
jgi:hypothetical protein